MLSEARNSARRFTKEQDAVSDVRNARFAGTKRVERGEASVSQSTRGAPEARLTYGDPVRGTAQVCHAASHME